MTTAPEILSRYTFKDDALDELVHEVCAGRAASENNQAADDGEDEARHDAAGAAAADVNNDGVERQIEFLLAEGVAADEIVGDGDMILPNAGEPLDDDERAAVRRLLGDTLNVAEYSNTMMGLLRRAAVKLQEPTSSTPGALLNMTVFYFANDTDPAMLRFECEAEDIDHAIEQFQDAEPASVVSRVEIEAPADVVSRAVAMQKGA